MYCVDCCPYNVPFLGLLCHLFFCHVLLEAQSIKAKKVANLYDTFGIQNPLEQMYFEISVVCR